MYQKKERRRSRNTGLGLVPYVPVMHNECSGFTPIGQLDMDDGLVRGPLAPPSREHCEVTQETQTINSICFFQNFKFCYCDTTFFVKSILLGQYGVGYRVLSQNLEHSISGKYVFTN